MDTEKQQQELNEAPASATVKITSPNGFEWLFTIRDVSAKTLAFKMNAMEMNWLKYKFTPVAQGKGFKSNPSAPERDLGKCPNCGSPMKMSKNGKPYCSALCWKNENRGDDYGY